MDSRDEKLTLENVDERIEECLSQSQESLSPTVPSLARTVHNLQCIYEEECRLEDVWTRINGRVSALNADRVVEQVDGLPGREQVYSPTSKRSRLLFRRSWYKPALGIAAAIIIVALIIWPIVSYAFQALQPASPQPSVKTVTPQIRPTVNVPKQIQTQTGTKSEPTVTTTSTPDATPSPTTMTMPSPTATSAPSLNVYSNQYFTIQYPANWVITDVTTGGSYQETVQFRPSATSSVFVNVDVMYSTSLTADLLLLADTDVKQGTLLSTSTVTYHGIPWSVGVVSLTGAQPSQEEVAYSNQNAPYKMLFSAPPDVYSSYTEVFNAMFASFYPAS